jgi:hypothetical protein
MRRAKSFGTLKSDVEAKRLEAVSSSKKQNNKDKECLDISITHFSA